MNVVPCYNPPPSGMTSQEPKQDKRQYALNLALAGFTGQVGFLTLGLVVMALLAGLWLDKAFGTRPLFLILLLLGSVPVTIFVMFRVALSFVARIKPASPTAKPLKEENSSDAND